MNDNTIRINLERERMLYLLDLFEKIQALNRIIAGGSRS
jgi:hypothetical protein